MKLALDTDRFSLFQGDSLAVLRSFADKSVDIVCTDPPYSQHTHEKLGKESRNDGTAARPELTFPPMTSELLDAVMKEIVRICRGWILVFADYYHTHLWGESARRHGGAWVRSGQWVKTNPMPQMTGDRPAVGSEDILIAHASADSRAWEWNGKGHSATWRGDRDKPWPNRDEGHPNQKPLWLLQSLLGMFAPANGIAFDPYIGSSGLAVAALATERFAGESPLETSCKHCRQKLLEAYQPPLPQNVSVIGNEGDQRWIDLSIARIRAEAPALFTA